jgi:hypothetical protein
MPKQTPPSMMPSSNAHKRRKKYKTNYVQVRIYAGFLWNAVCVRFFSSRRRSLTHRHECRSSYCYPA